MTRRQQVVSSLKDPEYRREFKDDIGTTIAFQIRLLREKQKLSQERLAELLGKRQATISLWENPDYGRYTLGSLKELAGAFDVGLIVRFAPYSELIDWTLNLSPDRLAPASFAEEFAPASVPLPVGDTTESSVLPAIAAPVVQTATTDTNDLVNTRDKAKGTNAYAQAA